MKFFRFNAGLAAVLMAVAFAFRPPETAATEVGRIAVLALVVAEAAIVVYWATVGRVLAKVRPLIAGIAVAGEPGRARGSGHSTRRRASATQVMTVASFLSSAALLGGACTAMILGHWYLVIPSLQVSHLQSIVKVHIASMVVRVVVVAAAVFLAIVTWQPGSGPSFRGYILSVSGIFFWQRVLFGLLGPGAALVPDLGDGQDPIDAVGHRHPLRGFLHRRRRRGAGEVPAARDARSPLENVVHSRIADCTAVRNLCNFSLRTASGPEGSSAK